MNSILNIFTASVRMAVPLGYAAIAGSVSEVAGIIALGLEGFMTVGAFAGVVGAYYTGSTLLGICIAALSGGIFSLLLGVFCIRFKSNQVVAGVGMNIIADGLVSVLMISIFGSKGKSELITPLRQLDLPVIKSLPVLGGMLSGYTGLVYLLILLMVFSWVVIYKTPIGIRLRATGINSLVVDSLGLKADMLKYISVFLSGVLAALGGTFLSMSQLNFYSKGMVSGRGYIALAIFVFARKNPVLCVLISILFGFTEAIQMRMQVLPIPTQFLSMLPYLSTLIVLSFSASKTGRSHKGAI